MLPILAQVGLAGFGLVHWAIMIIIVLAVVAIVVVFLRQTGLTIPPFIITILWIVLAAVICIAAIKFIVSIW
jgi:hypothetical protein